MLCGIILLLILRNINFQNQVSTYSTQSNNDVNSFSIAKDSNSMATWKTFQLALPAATVPEINVHYIFCTQTVQASNVLVHNAKA